MASILVDYYNVAANYDNITHYARETKQICISVRFNLGLERLWVTKENLWYQMKKINCF